MAPFSPRGDKSLRVIVTEMAAAGADGEVLTVGTLAEALNLDPADPASRGRIRQAVAAARNCLLKNHSKTLVSDRNRGYRIALPGEFAGLAEAHRERGQRQFAKGLAVIEQAPVGDMTPAELARHRAVGMVLRNLSNRLSSAEQRLNDLEDAVYGPPRTVIPGQIEENRGDLDAVHHDLDRLEHAIPQQSPAQPSPGTTVH